MYITSENMRRTTREHHRPFRTFYITPRGGLRKTVEKRMPKVNDVPTLWV